MQWIGKAVGGIVGFALGGPFGSLLGVFLGHQFDAGAGGDFAFGQGGFKAHRIQQAFFAATFEVMGHLAKSDGRVSENEIRVARQIMHSMRLSPEAVQSAIRHFTEGKQASYPMGQRLTALRELVGARRDIARAFVEIQVQAAVGAGFIDRPKRRSLLDVARLLGVDGAELAQMEAAARGGGTRGGVDSSLSLESAYRVLGIDQTASDREVKTAYRRLMNQHHPDKLVSRGLPEAMIDVAEQKTHEIRAAYERIKLQRSFK
jgi:DnaJ like chaperone protein